MGSLQDHTGKVFGRLTVIGRSTQRYGSRQEVMWDCDCACGNKAAIRSNFLNRGDVRSCGCLQRESRYERRLKHRLSHAPEYRVWVGMRVRCSNSKGKAYKNYGGRGITVCERWLSFENFFADMGERPGPYFSIDRIDNDGNYEPGNCRWASVAEQANNKSNTRYVEYLGKMMSVAEAVAAAGDIVTRETAISRLNTGWFVDAAVETPPLFRRDPTTRKVIRGKRMTRKSMDYPTGELTN